jgi:hypothetical protein
MPQADSHDTIDMSIFVRAADVALSAPRCVANKSVADISTNLLNDDAGLNSEPVSKQESKMSRRSALKTVVGVAGLELAAHSATAFASRRGGKTAQNPTRDPVFLGLERYKRATLEVIAAHQLYAIAEEKLPIELYSGPHVRLRHNPDGFAWTATDIDAFFDEIVEAAKCATRNFTDEARARVMAPIAKDRGRMHGELTAEIERYEKICRETGYDVADQRVRASFAEEAAALEALAGTEPTSVEGASALAEFLGTMMAHEEFSSDQDIAKRICANIANALASLSGRPIPTVMPYRFFPETEVA